MSNSNSYSDIRACAIDALGKIGDERVVEPLIDILSQKKGKLLEPKLLLLSAARTLIKIMNRQTEMQPLIDSMSQSDSRDILTKAIDFLGELGDERAVQPLIDTALNSNLYWDMQLQAIEALGKIGDKRAVQPLIDMISKSNSYDSRRSYAIAALGKIGDKRAVQPLVDALNDCNISVRKGQ